MGSSEKDVAQAESFQEQVDEKGSEQGQPSSLAHLVTDPKRVLRKVDWNVVPWVSFMYFLCFLDRFVFRSRFINSCSVRLIDSWRQGKHWQWYYLCVNPLTERISL
jgi:hypothetical protein